MILVWYMFGLGWMTATEQKHWKTWTDILLSLPAIFICGFLGPAAMLIPYAGRGRYNR
jgi:hypothetical protein